MPAHGRTQSRIIAAFDAAAAGYDGASMVQQEVARHLVGTAAAVRPRAILDIGCGTGHVAALAAARWPQAQVSALDASPAMLAAARQKTPHLRTIEGDAAAIGIESKFDLIFSSMLLHWLPEPRAALRDWRDLLTPDGSLFVALPVAGSLREWRDVCSRMGLQDGVWSFPEADFAAGIKASSEVRRHRIVYPTARAFLESIKHTGAGTARPNYTPLPIPAARRLWARAGDPFATAFDILYLHLDRSATGRDPE
jgi:trans-aconitate methyltransferase